MYLSLSVVIMSHRTLSAGCTTEILISHVFALKHLHKKSQWSLLFATYSLTSMQTLYLTQSDWVFSLYRNIRSSGLLHVRLYPISVSDNKSTVSSVYVNFSVSGPP